MLVSVVGVVLVVALLTIPAAMASQHVRSMAGMMAIASVLTLLFTVAGILLSFLADWPVGPTIILFAAAAYLLQSGFKRIAS